MSLPADNFEKTIHLSAREASLRRKIRRHLRDLGFHKAHDGSLAVDVGSKDVVRALHRSQRNERIALNAKFISRRAPELLRFFASGGDVDAAAIKPVLERVHCDTQQADLFRLASLTWSVPVSNGFGRRLRYLVWDANNEKLVGLIAIGDPVFNLSVRDNVIGWSVSDRRARLVNIMDAYVLGALPPYSQLLCGKMIACLVRSQDIYDDFSNKYGETAGIISKEEKKASLLSVTTSSSMGRSSVYNRLKLGGMLYFAPIGYTSGWGHFHIPHTLFAELRCYLRSIGHSYADLHRFGEGPNWRLRTTRVALEALGFKDHLLRHGVQRQVFICNLASNATSILRTGEGLPNLSLLLSAREVGEMALERWILPRAKRRPEYRAWTRDDLLQLVGGPPRQEGAGAPSAAA